MNVLLPANDANHQSRWADHETTLCIND